jgi:hypothetical protein
MKDEAFEHGPYHRVSSPTQSFQDAKLQRRSGELWGYTARGGRFPEVKAYRGPLPAGATGLEFRAPVVPGHTFGREVRWSVEHKIRSPYLWEDGVAKMKVQFTDFRYNCRKLTRPKVR